MAGNVFGCHSAEKNTASINRDFYWRVLCESPRAAKSLACLAFAARSKLKGGCPLLMEILMCVLLGHRTILRDALPSR